ncbi:MAG: M14 family metallopeptidase [Lachnospiraceae bacterium]|nr:M14 family metallopeptidase [Lachnospiraceae bacterium]
MYTEVIYESSSLYRDSFQIRGYVFGKGKKSVCIVGNLRGNEYQQLYTCSCIIQKLKKLEQEKLLNPGYEILVIPSANPYSINIQKRFWPIDNTDINRMFPGYVEGETTQRIAGGIFDRLKDYEYGIQLASYYMPGEFMPHINIMKTGFDYVEKAKKFGMPYVVLRNPRPYDTTTLNYNWQIWNTMAFSLYTTSTTRINQESAARGVQSILNFLAGEGIIRHSYCEDHASQVIDDEMMLSLRAPQAGLFEPFVHVEQEVIKGQLLAKIYNPLDGEEQGAIYAPGNGIVFFMHDEPLTYEHTAVIKMIPA